MATVRIVVTPEALVGALRLDSSMTIVDVRMNRSLGNWNTIVIEVSAPDAPMDAVGVEPVYRTRRTPDPVELFELRWMHRDGSQTVEPVTLPEKDAA